LQKQNKYLPFLQNDLLFVGTGFECKNNGKELIVDDFASNSGIFMIKKLHTNNPDLS
jgi:hypothetical protein